METINFPMGAWRATGASRYYSNLSEKTRESLSRSDTKVNVVATGRLMTDDEKVQEWKAMIETMSRNRQAVRRSRRAHRKAKMRMLNRR